MLFGLTYNRSVGVSFIWRGFIARGTRYRDVGA
jgi:hypothetical protein